MIMPATQSSFIRTAKQPGSFFIADNGCVNDSSLSIGAVGILAHLLSKPDWWVIRLSDLEKRFASGKTAIRTAFNELVEHGYITRIQERDEETGRMDGTTYTVHEKPEKPHSERITPDTENPNPGSERNTPDTDLPDAVNRTLDNTIGSSCISTEKISSPGELSSEAEPPPKTSTKAADLLEAVGVAPQIAAAIATQHSWRSIFEAVENGKAKGGVCKITGTPFNLPGYAVETLNTAFKEGHPVKPSALRLRTNRAAEEKSRDQKAHERKIGQQLKNYQRTGKVAG